MINHSEEYSLDFIKEFIAEIYKVSDREIDNHKIVHAYIEAEKKGVSFIFYELKILEAISNLFPEKTIDISSQFKENLGVDSLDLLELIMEIESIVGSEISERDISKISTIENVFDFVRSNY